MKLTEFLNDDTCQILLAIIVGIVICYFIFGSCSTGCSRREGFSVGVPFTDEQYNANPNGNLCKLGIEGHFADPDLSNCDPSDPNTASIQCCTGGDGDRDDFNSFMGRDFVLQNCSEDIQQQLNNYQERCNQLLEPGEPVEPVDPVDPVDPGPSACISGQTFNAGHDNPGFDPCSPCNQCNGVDDYGIKTNCTPTTNSVCNTLEDIVANRNISIAQDMRRMLLQLMVGDSSDKTTLNSMSMEPEVINTTIQSILAMSSSYDLHFIVLQNTPATTLSQQRRTANLQNFVDRVNIMPGNIGINVPLVLNGPQSEYSTYNLYNSLSKLPVEIQQILYCQRNTLSLREGDFYDPLLKVKTNSLPTDFSCDEPFDTETVAMTKSLLLSNYMRKLNISTGNTSLGSLYTGQNSLFADTGVNQLMVVSQSEDKSSDNLLTLDVRVSGNYTYNLDETTSVSLPDGFFTLLFTNGMSENGTPYDSLGDTIQEVISDYRELGIDESEINIMIWYLSLYTLQYYILKLFMGTDNAFGNTPQLDFTSSSVSGGSTRPDSNPLCTQSGKDYYIMGLVKKPVEEETSEHSEVVFNPESMSAYQMLGEDNPLGLYIGPGQGLGQKYTLAKINTENNCLPLEQQNISSERHPNLLVGDCNNPLNHGQNCNLSCADGYTPNDEQYLRLTCRDDGTLSEINPDLACNRRCNGLEDFISNKENVESGECGDRENLDILNHGETCNISCEDDYTSEGENTISCDNGELSNNLVCHENCKFNLSDNVHNDLTNPCPINEDLLTLYKYELNHEGTCKMKCDEGYVPKIGDGLTGAWNITCRDGSAYNGVGDLSIIMDNDIDYDCCPICEGTQVQNPTITGCRCVDPAELVETIYGGLGKALLKGAVLYCTLTVSEEEDEFQAEYNTCIGDFVNEHQNDEQYRDETTPSPSPTPGPTPSPSPSPSPTPSSPLTHEQIIEMYDINNDGTISTQDLLEVLAISGASLNNAETIRNHPELVDRIRQADTDNDGNINTTDVLNILRYISPLQVVTNSQDCNDCLTEAFEQESDPNLCISSNRCP